MGDLDYTVLLLLTVLLLQAAQLYYLRAMHRGFSEEDDEEEPPEMDGPESPLLEDALDSAARGPILSADLGDREELDVR